jgi:hypothetical protein
MTRDAPRVRRERCRRMAEDWLRENVFPRGSTSPADFFTCVESLTHTLIDFELATRQEHSRFVRKEGRRHARHQRHILPRNQTVDSRGSSADGTGED